MAPQNLILRARMLCPRRAELAPVTGVLDPAERQICFRPSRVIDKHHARVDAAGTRLPRETSLVKTEPPNPRSESFASATASSSFFTRKKSATGPKNSALHDAGTLGHSSLDLAEQFQQGHHGCN